MVEDESDCKRKFQSRLFEIAGPFSVARRVMNEIARTKAAMEAAMEGLGSVPKSDVFFACQRGDLATVEVLLKNGVDPNHSIGKLRLLHVAAYYGHAAIVSFLRNEFKLPETRAHANLRWWTPTHMAAVKGYSDCLRALRPGWQDLTRRDASNRTACHLAAYGGHINVLEEMLVAAPDPRSRLELLNAEGSVAPGDSFGNTPLDEATAGQHWTTVKFLLANGATLLHTDRCMNDLLTIADEDGNIIHSRPENTCVSSPSPSANKRTIIIQVDDHEQPSDTTPFFKESSSTTTQKFAEQLPPQSSAVTSSSSDEAAEMTKGDSGSSTEASSTEATKRKRSDEDDVVTKVRRSDPVSALDHAPLGFVRTASRLSLQEDAMKRSTSFLSCTDDVRHDTFEGLNEDTDGGDAGLCLDDGPSTSNPGSQGPTQRFLPMCGAPSTSSPGSPRPTQHFLPMCASPRKDVQPSMTSWQAKFEMLAAAVTTAGFDRYLIDNIRQLS